MIIGSDLDSCILSTQDVINKIFKEECDIDLTEKDITSYMLEDILPDIDKSVIRNCINKTLEQTIPPYDNASIVLRYLNDLYGKIHIVSKRSGKIYPHTLENIKQILPEPYNFELYFVGNYLDKKYLVEALGINLFIEDHPEIALDIIKHTDCTVLLMSWPWNEHVRETDRLIRVENWNDVREYVVIQEENK